MEIIKKLLFWFISFGLSFLVSEIFNCTEQAQAFLFIHLILGIIISMVCYMNFIFDDLKHSMSKFSFTTLVIVIALIVVFFSTWTATKLFNINFFLAYQIISFGQCFCRSNEAELF